MCGKYGGVNDYIGVGMVEKRRTYLRTGMAVALTAAALNVVQVTEAGNLHFVPRGAAGVVSSTRNTAATPARQETIYNVARSTVNVPLQEEQVNSPGFGRHQGGQTGGTAFAGGAYGRSSGSVEAGERNWRAGTSVRPGRERVRLARGGFIVAGYYCWLNAVGIPVYIYCSGVEEFENDNAAVVSYGGQGGVVQQQAPVIADEVQDVPDVQASAVQVAQAEGRQPYRGTGSGANAFLRKTEAGGEKGVIIEEIERHETIEVTRRGLFGSQVAEGILVVAAIVCLAVQGPESYKKVKGWCGEINERRRRRKYLRAKAFIDGEDARKPPVITRS